jgi:cytochrome b involved in lipid metabolism
MKYYILIALVLVIGSLGYYGYSKKREYMNMPSKIVVSSSTKAYTLTDIASHNSAASCWTAVNGYVYDVTTFINSHPGGKIILKACGTDGSALYNREDEHVEKNAQGILDSYFIGVLKNN